MSLTPHQRRLRQLEALLLPTPLCALDPAGESARASQIRDLFGLEAPSQAEKDQLKLAWDDAEGALEGPAHGDATTSSGALRLVHPLDPNTTLATVEPKALDAPWDEWIDALKKHHSDAQAPKAWQKLVRAVRAHPVFTQVPNKRDLPDHSVVSHRVLQAALIGARADGDEAALLLIQVGPVQPFIEASRRTRDLWAGSYLMSLMSAMVVKHLIEQLGPEAIITPQPESSALLRRIVYGDPVEDVSDLDALQPALPAKVMALVPSLRAEELGKGCLKAVEALWEKLWGCCAEQVDKRREGHFDGWDAGAKEQRAAFLERSYTVQPWPRDAASVWKYLDGLQPLLQTAPRPEKIKKSLGASYGDLSGAIWAIHSAQRDALVPPKHTGDNRFKCHVCGQLEALGPVDGHRVAFGPKGERLTFWQKIASEDEEKDKDREGYDLKPSEQLCAICLMKRLGVVGLVFDVLNGSTDDEEELRRAVRSFPSVPSLACAPFRDKMIRAVQANKDGARAVIEVWVKAIHAAINELPKGAPKRVRSGIARVHKLVREVDGDTNGLAREINEIDGSWFDEDAYEPERAWTEQVGKRPAPNDETFIKFGELLRAAAPLWQQVTQKLGKPSHYVAALYLDGDQLSKWLNGSHKKTPTYGELMGAQTPAGLEGTPRAVSPALQGELSARLSALAGGAVKDVVDEHFGRLVYCGGDDVVALLPGSYALRCADALATLIQRPESLSDKVTVSAGIHIQHQREPLGRLIKGARKAEKLSKDKGRDRLTITLTPRSGDGLTFTVCWSDKVHYPGETTVELLCALAGQDENKPWWDGDSNDSPLNLKLGHVLRAELGTLGYRPTEQQPVDRSCDGQPPPARRDWGPLLPIIESRVLALADATSAESPKRRALRLPLALLDTDNGDPDRMVKTLLLARFLDREARNGET